mgnify:CR=1 FL=1
MDPNETLAELRELVTLQRKGKVHPDKADYYVRMVSDLVEALDEWLSKGGFMPEDWDKRR